jgi:YD repeat-containing protein
LAINDPPIDIGSKDFDLMQRRGSGPRPESVTSQTLSFRGPSGLVSALVVPAEAGRLAFVTPKSPLLPGTKYSLTLQGASDHQGLSLALKMVSFTTAARGDTAGNSDSAGSASDTSTAALTPLQAAPGVTAVAGQTLRLDGGPLENVTFKIDNKVAHSDRTGRFLLANVTAGHHAIVIDGRSANRRNEVFGVFEVGIDLIEHQTTILPYKIWMTELDMAHAVRVQFPTTKEVVITTPKFPGLEFRIPPNTVITDLDGKIADKISITPIPLDKPPFPLPSVQVPIYFTIQPGGGYIQVNSSDGQKKGARLIYPNAFHQAPGSTMDFWNYDPDTRGWFIYGKGRVSPDGKSVIPDPGVMIYELTGAMVAGPGSGPGKGGPIGGGPVGGGGDPVDLSTGLFVYNKTDLSLNDVIPIALTRVYRQGDTLSRAFGIGMTHPYDMFVIGALSDFSYVELVTPNGSRVRFDRTSGNIWSNSTLQCVTTPGAFYGAVFSNKNGWTITTRDGTAYTFIQTGILGPSKYQDVALTSITDRNGNVVKVVRDSSNYVSRVVSPNGRWIQLTYDGNHRITSAEDNLGRSVSYSYDPQGRLIQVTDANSGVWTYRWDPTKIDQMTSLTDARQIQFLQNHYDGNGRVDRQTQADGTTFIFNYTVDVNNNITRTQVTDPNGNVRTTIFSPPPPSADGTYISGGYVSNDTRVVGPDHHTTVYQRDPSSNLLLSQTDSLNRQTTYTYDALGNVASVTRLAGTPNAATTSFTHESSFNLLTSISDPLQHATTLGTTEKGISLA